MNRRTFLGVCAVAACGPSPRPRPNGNGSGSSSEVPPPDGGRIVDDFSHEQASQLRPSPLAVRADTVVQVTPDGLVFVNATTLAQVDRISATYRSHAMLRTGALVAFELSTCELDLIEGIYLTRSMPVPGCLPIDGAHVVAGTASDVYLSRGEDSFVRYRLANGSLVDDATLRIEGSARNGLDQIIVHDDGRVLVPAGKALEVYAAGTRATLPATHRMAHLARGPAGRVWYSAWDANGAIPQVVLARVESTIAIDASIAVAPSRVIHMAAGETGALAVLLHTVGERAFEWSILLLDEKGAERRRFAVDADIVAAVKLDLNVAFIALTTHSVVISAGRHGLFAWTAATGARITRGSHRGLVGGSGAQRDGTCQRV